MLGQVQLDAILDKSVYVCHLSILQLFVWLFTSAWTSDFQHCSNLIKLLGIIPQR